MRAIILAAGRGSRLGALTQEQPKCLTLLAGKSLLDWQLEALRGAGISQIGIVRGYLAEKLARSGLAYFANPRWTESNMVESLLCAGVWLEREPFILSYADLAYPAQAILALKDEPGDIVVAYDPHWFELWQARFENPLADAETFEIDPQGRLTEIGARATTRDQIQGQYMGLLKFSVAGWNRTREFLNSLDAAQRQRLDMTALLRLLVAAGWTIQTVPVACRWYEVDNENDLQIYSSLITQRGGELWRR